MTSDSANCGEGVWLRPRQPDLQLDPDVAARVRVLKAARTTHSAQLAGQLWDLSAWAATGHSLLDEMAAAKDAPDRFVLAAATVRHLLTDPTLPAELLPADTGPRVHAACNHDLRRRTGGTTRLDPTGGGDMNEPVQVERKGPVTTVIIDRPNARNAVNGPTAEALYTAFDEFDRDDTASGGRAMGRPRNLLRRSRFEGIRHTASQPGVPCTGPGPMGPTRMVLSKPVIAAVSGQAVAGGLELALWCDLRVAEEDAVFGVFCRRWGVPLIDGGTVRLPRLIGLSRAMDMILTGRAVAADEALAMGLANRVVPKGQARQAAEELAAQLAALPQQCMRSDRLSALQQWGLPEAQAIDVEFASISRVAAEAMEGAGRFAAGVAAANGALAAG